jgi:hypothetical protein
MEIEYVINAIGGLLFLKVTATVEYPFISAGNSDNLP